MNIRNILDKSSKAFLAGLCFASVASAADYEIDSSHSSVAFKIKHLAISTVPGRFTSFSGTYSYDPANVEASKAEVKIEAKSIDTDEPKRDDHLRNPDFFNVTKYPELTFKTTKIESEGKDKFKAHGDLTIAGTTKPVVLDVEFTGGAKDPWGKERTAFSATTKINRKDFGLTWNKALETGGLVVGEEVTITIDVEGVKKA